MKKIFSLFTAILFAGSMMAAEVTTTYVFSTRDWNATENSTQANWTCGLRGSGFTAGQGVQISASATGANATSPKSFTNVSKIVVHYCTNKSAGTGNIAIKIGEGTAQSFDVQAPSSGGTTLKTKQFDFDPNESGSVKITVTCTKNSLYVHSIDITEVQSLDPSVPSILVDPVTIDFGTVEQGDEVEAQDVEVTFANLTGAVTYSGLSDPFSASGSIAATGDKITISASTATVGDYNQTLTVASAADEKSATVTVKLKVNAPAHKYQATIDCSTAFGDDFEEWGTSYAEHSVSNADATLYLASACHQTSTITDVPVTKGGDVVLVITNTAKDLAAVKFVCKQWGTKAQTITLQYSTDGGENYSAFTPAVTSDNFVIEKLDLATGVNAVKISFSSQSNQVGIASVSYDLKDNGSATAIDNTEASVKAVKFVENGQLFIEKNGHVYNVQGQILK